MSQWIADLSLRWKLLGMFVVLLMVVGSAAGIGLVRLRDTVAAYSALNIVEVDAARRAADLNTAFITRHKVLKDVYLFASDPARVKRAVDEVNALDRIVDSELEFLQHLPALLPSEHALVEEALLALVDYRAGSARAIHIVQLSSNPMADQARAAQETYLQDRAVSAALDRLSASLRARAAASEQKLDLDSERTLGLTIATMLLTAILGLVLAIGFTQWLHKSVSRLADGAGRIADGELGARINLRGGDELGTTAAAFDRMADALQTNLHKLESSAARTQAAARLADERAAHLHSVAEAAQDGIISADRDGRITYWNAGARTIFGYSVEEVLGQELELLMPSVHAAALQRLQPIGEEHMLGRTVELVGRRSDGEEVPIELSLGTWETATGESFTAIVRDITDRKLAERALRASEERLRTVVEHVPVVLFALDTRGVFTLIEGEGLAALGLKPGALVGLSIRDVYPEYPQVQEIARRALTGETFVSTSQLGALIYETWCRPLLNAAGDSVGVIGVATDVTARQQAEQAKQASDARLRASERRYRQMFENNEAIKLLVDPVSGTIVEANAAASAFYGYPPAELLGHRMSDINTLPADELAVLLARVVHGECFHFETQHRLATGEIRDVEVYSSPLSHLDEAPGHGLLYSIIHDITDRKRATEALQHQALHDALTGLPNRILLQDRLQETLLLAQREGTSLALLLLDLDRFKEINDTFGHMYGDRLLTQIGPRLRSVLRASDSVARLGGDEFAVLLPGADTPDAVAIAQHLLQTLNEPFELEEHAVEVGASIGIVASPAHGNDAESMLRRADVAMYVAKASRSGLAVYTIDQDHHSADKLALVGELREAICQDQLVLHYQPKVDFAGRLAGVEALVRWQHPRRGLVPPDVFIGLAENTGLIKPLTRWVLDAALRQCRRWLDAGSRIPVAVNFSTQDLQDEGLPDALTQLLTTRGVPAPLLRVEITEGAIMSEPVRAMDVLGRLRKLGVGVSVDDFGTGYSSLAYLKRLPVDELKIDRSFVSNLPTDNEDAAIVRSTIGLGHELGLQVIAEGVEDETTWRLLEGFGCDLVQGYFVGRPVPAAELERWLVEPVRFPNPQVAPAA